MIRMNQWKKYMEMNDLLFTNMHIVQVSERIQYIFSVVSTIDPVCLTKSVLTVNNVAIVLSKNFCK